MFVAKKPGDTRELIQSGLTRQNDTHTAFSMEASQQYHTAFLCSGSHLWVTLDSRETVTFREIPQKPAAAMRFAAGRQPARPAHIKVGLCERTMVVMVVVSSLLYGRSTCNRYFCARTRTGIKLHCICGKLDWNGQSEYRNYDDKS